LAPVSYFLCSSEIIIWAKPIFLFLFVAAWHQSVSYVVLISELVMISLFISVLRVLVFFALTLAFQVQLFTRTLCLQISRVRMRNFMWNWFPIENLLINSLLTPIMKSTYMCKVESLQKDESRAQSADLLKTCRKPRAFTVG